MSRSRSMRAAVVGALLGSLAVAGMVGSAYSEPAPEAQAANHAAVVVDGYAPRCITFTSESVSGTQALQMAGFSTTIRSYSGEGGAVCAINGTGCAADANCLTCSAPNYWAYFRSDSGSGGFTYSNAAATSTQVTDGDVEGWRWGTGAAPGYTAFADVCPLDPPTPTTSTTNPPSHDNGGGNGNGNGNGNNGGPTGGPSDSGGPGTPGTTGQPGDPQDDPTTTTAPGDPTTTTEAGSPDRGGSSDDVSDDSEDVDGEEAANVTDVADDGGGGGARTWVAFAVVLGGFGLAGWRVRRIRGRST